MKMPAAANVSRVANFRQELDEFRAHCHRNNLDFEAAVRKCLKEETIQQKRHLYIFLLLVTVATVTMYFTWDAWTTHLWAWIRILMVQSLPLYDWRPLKDRPCLVSRTTETIDKTPECDYCDPQNFNTLDPNDVGDDPTSVIQRHYEMHAPVVVKHRCRFDFDRLLGDQQYLNSAAVCDFASNAAGRQTATVGELLGTFADYPFYFYHFRHCHFRDVKLFRRFFRRPDILDDSISPVQHSWLVVSRNYNASTYKRLMTGDRLTAWVQVEGSNEIELRPDAGCDCLVKRVLLKEGDALIVSDYWDIFYKPGFTSTSRNVAVVIEAH